MARPRKNSIGQSSDDGFRSRRERKWVDCKICFDDGAYVASDIASIICASCVSKQVAPPEEKIKKTGDDVRPRGWHLKREYISPEGKVYHRGVEANEANSNTDAIVENLPRRGRPKKSPDSNTGSNGTTQTNSAKPRGRRRKQA